MTFNNYAQNYKEKIIYTEFYDRCIDGVVMEETIQVEVTNKPLEEAKQNILRIRDLAIAKQGTDNLTQEQQNYIDDWNNISSQEGYPYDVIFPTLNE